MSSNWWADKVGALAHPPAPVTMPRTAWWQEQPDPMQLGYYHPEAQAARQAAPGITGEQYIRQLQRLAADELTQEQMEAIAAWELQNKPRYNQQCPRCGSGNFASAGTKLGNVTLGSDKCFDCGGSSSTYVSSPEPAVRGRGRSPGARQQDVRQIDTGGGVKSMYLRFNGVPGNYVPRGG